VRVITAIDGVVGVRSHLKFDLDDTAIPALLN
jgi:hypothetical protein